MRIQIHIRFTIVYPPLAEQYLRIGTKFIKVNKYIIRPLIKKSSHHKRFPHANTNGNTVTVLLTIM